MPAPDGKAVLVVDDDPLVLRLVESALVKCGYRVLPAMDGEFALRVAKGSRPAAVLLDLMMPKVDGWQFMDLLKAEPEIASIPVVMITAKAPSEVEPVANAKGVFRVLYKPLHLGEVLNAIAEAIK